MTDPPKVSVIVISKNEEEVIKECLDSISVQTYPNLEIVAVDSSQDKTYEIVSQFSLGSVIPMKIFSVPPVGAGYARNVGLEKSEGRFVAFVDADETIPPKFIEKSISVILANPNILAVYTPRILQNTRTNFGKTLLLYTRLFTFTETNFDIPRIYDKKFFEIVGYYDSRLISHEDIELMIRAADKLGSNFSQRFAHVDVAHFHNWENKSGIIGHFSICIWNGEGFARLLYHYPKKCLLTLSKVLYLFFVPIASLAVLIDFQKTLSFLFLIPFFLTFPYCALKARQAKLWSPWSLVIPFLMIYKAFGCLAGIFKWILRSSRKEGVGGTFREDPVS